MLADKVSQKDKRKSQTFVKTNVSNSSKIETLNHSPEIIDSTTKKELTNKISTKEEFQENANINLDETWKKVLAMLELPSTKMLLSQQAKLINLNSSSAEIAISEKWINMIQSRKNLIEDAFYKAQGSPTKVILIEEKGNFLNNKKDGVISKKIEEKKEFKVNQKENKND